MKDIKENVDDYLLAYHYASQKYDKITLVEIINDRKNATVWYITQERTQYFNYSDENYKTIDLTTEEFKIFERDYNLGILLYDPERPDVYDNENITYLRYLNMLSKEKGTFHNELLKYMRTRKIGDPVFYSSRKAVINEINLHENTAIIYDHHTQEVIENVPLGSLRPRSYIKTKPTEELVPELLGMNTIDLLRLKNDFYGRSYTLGLKYTQQDINDVLHKREHVESKKKNLKTNHNGYY
tara:strand:- start:257 stop:976 length:720 start_codon:yes stop_codon:yes gene_type:complete